MELIKNVDEIGVGDLVRLVEDGKTIVEGEIEFIDFSIPFFNVSLTIDGKHYNGDKEWYLIKVGTRTAAQVQMTKKRIKEVIAQIKYLDGGGDKF